MTFNDITNQLLSKDNCALLIGGALFIQNLHSYVKTTMLIVGTTTNPAKSEQCIELKKQLLHILNNYNTARRMPVGSKRPK